MDVIFDNRISALKAFFADSQKDLSSAVLVGFQHPDDGVLKGIELAFA